MTDETATVADRLEIEELLARYNTSFDLGRVEDWVATFTPDGEFRNRVGDVWRGSEQLRAFAQSFADPDDPARSSQHWVNNVVLTPTDAGMSLLCYGMIMTVADGTPAIRSMTAYADELRRAQGRWRFARRTVLGWPAPAAG